MTISLPETPVSDGGIGVVAPYDFALDRELWRWTPPDVDLFITRTRYVALSVGVEQALTVGSPAEVAELAREVGIAEPGVAAYMCTSGSFCRGVEGERALTQAMLDAGFPAAITTSGALVAALEALDATTISVVTPYDEPTTALLTRYLGEVGVSVLAANHMGLTGNIWEVPYDVTADLIRGTVRTDPRPDAVFVSCTNLRSFDLIEPLEQELGLPVITANQVSMWCALGHLGHSLAPSSALGNVTFRKKLR